MQHKLIASLAALGVLAGCANIGEVNGVPVGQNATVSAQSAEDPFCARQPEVCILGAALLLGVVGAVASSGSSSGANGVDSNDVGDGATARSRGGTNINIVQRSGSSTG